jgi:hypothetical protein
MDFANPKCYPGSGTTIFNLNKTGDFTFNSSLAPTFSNGVAYTNGLNPGSRFFEQTGGLGDHGTNSFTYQMLVKPLSSTSIEDPNSARLYEQLGWPDTYHIVAVYHNSGSPSLRFFSGGTDTDSWNIGTPNGSVTLGDWYFITSTVDRENNLVKLYQNGVKYQQSYVSANTVGNLDPLSFPTSYAEAEAEYSFIIGYSRALTDDEVLYNFNSLRGRYGI